MVLKPLVTKEFAVPKNYMPYGLIVPVNNQMKVNPVKQFFISVLMGLATKMYAFGVTEAKRYKQIIMTMPSPPNEPFTLPENYMTYGLIIPTNKQGLVNPVKCIFSKVFLTLAERIAEF